MSNPKLALDCVDIVKELLEKHPCLRPAHDLSRAISMREAHEIAADLKDLIHNSAEIQAAHAADSWRIK